MSNELLWLIAGFSTGFITAMLIVMYGRYKHDAQVAELNALHEQSIRCTTEMLQAAAELREVQKVSMN